MKVQTVFTPARVRCETQRRAGSTRPSPRRTFPRHESHPMTGPRILNRWFWRIAWTLALGGMRLWLRGEASAA